MTKARGAAFTGAMYAKLDPVWYRLLVPLPQRVVVHGRAQLVMIHEVGAGIRYWKVEAKQEGTARYAIVSEDFRTREGLEAALYREGFATRWRIDGYDIMQAMVEAGLAERLADREKGPEPKMGNGRPWNW